uniref:hypothetical protein n=1 Tax=Hydrocytium acuminatum TaxID=1745963 RepID=UPI002A7F8BBB|nr:hypothetical protein UYM18_pgp108 [Hydrocytium acuminatum]WOR09512.1 hypothetical protein [Hydrocytium acuminatum]
MSIMHVKSGFFIVKSKVYFFIYKQNNIYFFDQKKNIFYFNFEKKKNKSFFKKRLILLVFLVIFNIFRFVLKRNFFNLNSNFSTHSFPKDLFPKDLENIHSFPKDLENIYSFPKDLENIVEGKSFNFNFHNFFLRIFEIFYDFFLFITVSPSIRIFSWKTLLCYFIGVGFFLRICNLIYGFFLHILNFLNRWFLTISPMSSKIFRSCYYFILSLILSFAFGALKNYNNQIVFQRNIARFEKYTTICSLPLKLNKLPTTKSIDNWNVTQSQMENSYPTFWNPTTSMYEYNPVRSRDLYRQRIEKKKQFLKRMNLIFHSLINKEIKRYYTQKTNGRFVIKRNDPLVSLSTENFATVEKTFLRILRHKYLTIKNLEKNLNFEFPTQSSTDVQKRLNYQDTLYNDLLRRMVIHNRNIFFYPDAFVKPEISKNFVLKTKIRNQLRVKNFHNVISNWRQVIMVLENPDKLAKLIDRIEKQTIDLTTKLERRNFIYKPNTIKTLIDFYLSKMIAKKYSLAMIFSMALYLYNLGLIPFWLLRILLIN